MTTRNHRCQIDCTNHDEVVNNLELKSKDLYYFWKNYEWLYNRYLKEYQREQREPLKPEVVKVKENHDKCEKEIEKLENENESLKKENKNLRMNIQTCKKQIDEMQNNNKFEMEYKNQIKQLTNKNSEFQSIMEKQQAEIAKLIKTNRANQDEFESEKANFLRQNKKSRQTIIQLQQTIDQFRNKSSPLVPQIHTSKQEGPSFQQIEEFRTKQTTLVTSKIRNLSEEVERLVSQECDSMRREFQQRFQEILEQLTQRQLQTIIQIVQT